MSVYYNLKSIEELTVAAFNLGDSKREGQVVFLHLGHLTAWLLEHWMFLPKNTNIFTNLYT